jgi:hypothetical protein
LLAGINAAIERCEMRPKPLLIWRDRARGLWRNAEDELPGRPQQQSLRTSADAAKAASLSWNAFFRNEVLSIVRVFKTPVQIAGVKMVKPPKE